MRVSPLKAGHSNRIECAGNPVNHTDPFGLETANNTSDQKWWIGQSINYIEKILDGRNPENLQGLRTTAAQNTIIVMQNWGPKNPRGITDYWGEEIRLNAGSLGIVKTWKPSRKVKKIYKSHMAGDITATRMAQLFSMVSREEKKQILTLAQTLYHESNHLSDGWGFSAEKGAYSAELQFMVDVWNAEKDTNIRGHIRSLVESTIDDAKREESIILKNPLPSDDSVDI